MRLLNTTTYIVKEFSGNEIPKYAILSHRWGNQEVSFQDIQHFKNFRDYFKSGKSMKTEGWSKIRSSCEQAVMDGFQWIWVDSCCIDKMSSAELSEAINSMFNWYRQAQVCYAYLSDVFVPWSEKDRNGASLAEYQLRSSRWFRRGWTLQELLAPRKLVFFSRSWASLGTRTELWRFVSMATGIKDEMGWEAASVAQKMSWASTRETTRSEDRAYSLMGLFGVNMPPLYGEGENAFIRLQLEILRTSDDESIFAWRDPNNTSGGLLARSPNAFQHSGNIERFDSIHYEKPPYSMTNKGLSMEFSLVMASSQEKSIFDADDTYLAPLQCQEGKSYAMLAILLKRIRGSHYRRISSGEVISLPWNHRMLSQLARRTVVQVKQEDDFQRSFEGVYQYKFFVASNVLSLRGFEVTARYTTQSQWSHGNARRLENGLIVWDDQDSAEQSLLIDAVGGDGVTAALEFTRKFEDSSSSQEADSAAEPAAAEFEEAEAQNANAAPYAESERFVAIFNIYSTRTRVGIIRPKKDETMQALLERLFQYHRQGDWMTAGQQLFPEPRLTSEARITAELIRDHNELGMTSYEAKISFDEAVAELPNNAVLPIELPNSEISVLPWHILPRVPELDNTVVNNRKPHTIQNLITKDPLFNQYISSYLQHRDLELQKQKFQRSEMFEDDEWDDEDGETSDASGLSDQPNHSMQLEIQEARHESVSPMLPDLHRMSGFGVDLFSLPMFSETEEPVPPVPAHHKAEFTFPLSSSTYTEARTASPDPLSPTSPVLNSNVSYRAGEDQEDEEEDYSNDEESGTADEEDGRESGSPGNKIPQKANDQKTPVNGGNEQRANNVKRRKRKGTKTRKVGRKGKDVQK